jgi:hypothetical protein
MVIQKSRHILTKPQLTRNRAFSEHRCDIAKPIQKRRSNGLEVEDLLPDFDRIWGNCFEDFTD